MRFPVRRRIPAIALAALLVFALPAVSAAAGDSMSEAETKAIEKIVRDYIANHPEIIGEALRELQRREQVAEVERQRSVLSAHSDALRYDPDSFVGGNPDGTVTVVEFFDYSCGYCKRAQPVLKALLSRNDDIRFVYKEFPILGPGSVYASMAAIASLEQDGKYEAFHHALMATRGNLTEERVMRIAEELGLDVEKLKKDMAKPKPEQVIRRNRQIASALQINGTPAFVIGDTVVPGYISLEQMSSLVAEARNGCATC